MVNGAVHSPDRNTACPLGTTLTHAMSAKVMGRVGDRPERKEE